MSELKINLDLDRTSFEPGEEVTGTAGWTFAQPPRAVELRLFWFTRGKGTEDAAVVEKKRFEQPSRAETHSFRFRLPNAPYSFSGKLISLVWALELVAEPGKELARVEIIIGPEGREVRLDSLPENAATRALFGGGSR